MKKKNNVKCFTSHIQHAQKNIIKVLVSAGYKFITWESHLHFQFKETVKLKYELTWYSMKLILIGKQKYVTDIFSDLLYKMF